MKVLQCADYEELGPGEDAIEELIARPKLRMQLAGAVKLEAHRPAKVRARLLGRASAFDVVRISNDQQVDVADSRVRGARDGTEDEGEVDAVDPLEDIPQAAGDAEGLCGDAAELVVDRTRRVGSIALLVSDALFQNDSYPDQRRQFALDGRKGHARAPHDFALVQRPRAREKNAQDRFARSAEEHGPERG